VTYDPAHTQASHRIRFDWGPTGAEATSAAYAVVVDVLTFTTTVSVAVDQGIEVFPYPWRDSGAAAHALRHGAKLAVGRFEARGSAQASLSPASLESVVGVERLVLPSPNGSTLSFMLADSGTTVLAACLRNRTAVADWLAPRLAGPAISGSSASVAAPGGIPGGIPGSRAGGSSLAVIAAGERWPDGSLRPCAEDLWGAGAVLAALVDRGVGGLSPEARIAEQAFRAVEPELAAELNACAGARELVEIGFGRDVEVAAALDASDVVPVLDDERFVRA